MSGSPPPKTAVGKCKQLFLLVKIRVESNLHKETKSDESGL